jgi:hypothetical protein
MTLDLFTRTRLSAALSRIDTDDPAGAVWDAMREGFGFCRGGTCDRRMIAGFGITGHGQTWDEAARQWVQGAREMTGAG